MSVDQWGVVVASTLGFGFLVAAVVALIIRKRRIAGYLAAASYIMLFPIHLWFWQFELTGRAPVGAGYIWNGAQQIVLSGIVPLIVVSSFRRFRPVVTALLLLYVFSLLLQLFSYIYWSYGTTRNFSIRLSHLDSFYFALGTLTTAGTGNVSATSETSRQIQTLQMGLDLIFVGIVVAIILTRYSNLLTRPQVEFPHDGTSVIKPTPAVDSSDQSQHASELNDPYSDHPDAVPRGDPKDGVGAERRLSEATQPDCNDRGQGGGSRQSKPRPTHGP
jgi:Ion channel